MVERLTVRRWARALVTVIASLTAAVLVFAVAGLPVYVFPAVDSVRPADAVFVLGPPSQPRVSYAEHLMDEGLATTLVLSTKPAPTSWDDIDACAGDRPYSVICFVSDPHTTQGEAEELRSLAQEHGWDRVIVVTFASHISRARVIMQRCYSGELMMSAAPKRYTPIEWVREYLYQTGAFVKVLFDQAC